MNMSWFYLHLIAKKYKVKIFDAFEGADMYISNKVSDIYSGLRKTPEEQYVHYSTLYICVLERVLPL